MSVCTVYHGLPWQMDDLTPMELDGMIETAKALAGGGHF